MVATVTAITCPAGEWTLISDGKASVAFQWRGEGAFGRWVIGQAAAPAVDTTHYMTIRPKSPQSLNDLALGDKVWAMPEGGASQIMEVITP